MHARFTFFFPYDTGQHTLLFASARPGARRQRCYDKEDIVKDEEGKCRVVLGCVRWLVLVQEKKVCAQHTRAHTHTCTHTHTHARAHTTTLPCPSSSRMGRLHGGKRDLERGGPAHAQRAGHLRERLGAHAEVSLVLLRLPEGSLKW